MSEKCAHRRLHRTQEEGTANRRAPQTLSGDASLVVDAVRAVDGVLRAEPQGRLLRVFSDRGGRVISPVIQAAEERGTSVANITLIEPSLETLFVSRTGRKLD